MKFGKQLKLQSVKEWQEYYMSYKRLKRIIKKLMVQMKEREAKQMRELAEGGKLSSEQLARMQAEAAQSAVAKSKSPNLQSFSPTLSTQSTPERDANGKKIPAARMPSRLSMPGGESQPHLGLHASPYSTSGSPGLLLGGDAYQEFFSVVESDVEKVNRFYAAKLEELNDSFLQLINAPSGGRFGAVHGGNGSGDRRDSDETSPVTPRHNASGFHNSVAAVASWMAGRKKTSRNASAELSPSSRRETNYGTLEAGGSAESKESDSLVSGGDRAAAAPARTISTSQQKRLEARLEKLLDLYRPALQLQIYSMINYEGLRKIIKKFDKNTGEEHSDAWVERLDQQPFRDTDALNALIAQIEDLYTRLNCRRPNQDIWSSQNMLRGVKREVDNPTEEDPQQHEMSVLYVLLAIAVACAVLLLPILPHEPRAKSCAALLGMITVLWVSEAVPFFVGALCIPFTVVVLGILADPTGTPLAASQASKAAFGYMFNDTTMLILGGFSISAAFSKCNFELRLASVIQRACGDKPRIFLLAFMLLGAFLSCWISNIAAPLLLTTLLLPIVRDFGAASDYSRALLLGLAIAGNIGGMMSPIASPQNAIALGYLNSTLPTSAISFARWLSVSFPFCLILILLSWVYLVVVFLRHGEDVPEVPMIVFEKQPVDRQQVAVVLVSLATIVLWCTLSETKQFFGEMGTIAVIPIVVFFGTGILGKADLMGFNWSLILLIGGGNCLGAAVNSSQLLHIISQALEPYLAGHSAYVTTVSVLLAVFLVTTFVSHTVAALILTPIIVDIAVSSGEVQVVVMLSTLMMSGAMSLPMSSFPNANSLLIDDDFGRNFIHPMDFIKHGSAISVLILAALCSVGYMLAYVMLDHDSGAVEQIRGAKHGRLL